jgi:hypothetical protein
MDNLKPSAIALLGGGGLLFISSFLKWRGDQSGISFDAAGLQGLICLVIGAAVVILVAMANFGGRTTELSVGGLTTNDVYLTLGLTAFLITFGLQLADSAKFGLFVGWVGAAAIIVGAFMDSRSDSTATTPPTPF